LQYSVNNKIGCVFNTFSVTDSVIQPDTATCVCRLYSLKIHQWIKKQFSKKHWNFHKFYVTSGFSHFKCVSCVVDDFLKKKYVPYFWEDSGCDYTRGPDVLKIKFVTRNAGQLVLVQCRCLALISRESSWCHIHWHMQGSVHV